MIGLGLSLMGGALAQNDQGGGEAMYFPSRIAVCSQPARPTLTLLEIDVRRGWLDEKIWFECKSAFAAVNTYTQLGAYVTDTSNGSGRHFGAVKQPISDGQYKIRVATQNFGNNFSLGEIAPDEIQVSFWGSVGDTASTFSYKTDISGLDIISGSRRLENMGALTGTRYVILNTAAREFRGLSFRTAAGGYNFNYLPLADGFGNHAVWSTYDNTLVEI